MWTYKIASGQMLGAAGQCFQGYSGAGHSLAEGRDNPQMVGTVGKGPIPPGHYTIGTPVQDVHTGPYSMHLTPEAGTDTLGRSAFLIHGNNAESDASHGCVIMPPDARHAIWESGDHELEVIL